MDQTPRPMNEVYTDLEGQTNGYNVWFRQHLPIGVKDPTRLLKLVPKHQNMVNLISEEIRTLFPPKRVFDLDKAKYTIHCSQVFLRAFMNDFLKSGFPIGEPIEVDPTNPIKVMTPMLGEIQFVPDLEQGYKIEQA